MAKSNKTSGRMDTPVLLDRRSKEKSSFFNQKRKGLLSFYGNISRIPVLGSVFSETARKVVGGSLHTHKVEVNSTCNQQCRTCYVSDRKTDLSRAVLRQIAREIRGCKINFDIMGGEPLLRHDFEEIIEEAKQVGKSPRVTMYTNGLLATSECCRSPTVSAVKIPSAEVLIPSGPQRSLSWMSCRSIVKINGRPPARARACKAPPKYAPSRRVPIGFDHTRLLFS